MVMVLATDGRSPLVFIDCGVKLMPNIIAKYFGGCIEALGTQTLRRHPWTFQQDLATSHSARATAEWLKSEVPRFISIAQWSPKSPDANPLDYCV